MKHKLEYINSELKNIRKHNLYRKMNDSKIAGAYITINSKTLINMCSNDYLGITQPKILNKQNQSSSRLISGNDNSFRILEEKLAKHKSQERSLIFPTGYMANIGVITSIIGKNDLILSDKLNHVSLIEACKLSNAKLSIFKHNDMNDLTRKIKTEARRKFIITEGIFSMDGDFSNLDVISEISKKNNAIIILDDAHGDFIIGNDGKGTANHFKVSKKIDGIGISGQMHGILLLDGLNNPVTNFISWQDQRATDLLSKSQETYLNILKDNLQKYRSLTGTDLRSGMMGPLLFWFKRNGYLNSNDKVKATFISDYIVSMLTENEPLCDPTNASGSGIYNIKDGEWLNEYFEITGIDYNILPNVVETKSLAGQLAYRQSKELNMKQGTPVYVSIGDYQAALVSSKLDDRCISINIGTGAQVSSLINDYISTDNYEIRYSKILNTNFIYNKVDNLGQLSRFLIWYSLQMDRL